MPESTVEHCRRGLGERMKPKIEELHSLVDGCIGSMERERSTLEGKEPKTN